MLIKYVFEQFGWASHVRSKLTSYSLTLIMSSSFFMNLLHSAIYFLTIWHLTSNWQFIKIFLWLTKCLQWMCPHHPRPLHIGIPLPLGPIIIRSTTNSHHSAFPWTWVIMLSPIPLLTHIFLPNSAEFMWPQMEFPPPFKFGYLSA